MRFKQYLLEQAKKDGEKKIVFKETDGRSPFPDNTVNALTRQVSTMANDLELEWSDAATLVAAAFDELEVPKPQAFQIERWAQYTELLAHAIKQLYKSRGMKGGWTRTV